MLKLKRDYMSYLELIISEEYTLAVPNQNVLNNCTIDEVFIRKLVLTFSGTHPPNIRWNRYAESQWQVVHPKKQ